jgi:hypothetical protein
MKHCAGEQWPPLQKLPGRHTFPQPPQLSVSLDISEHWLPPQQVAPERHGASGQFPVAAQDWHKHAGQLCGMAVSGQDAGQFMNMVLHPRSPCLQALWAQKVEGEQSELLMQGPQLAPQSGRHVPGPAAAKRALYGAAFVSQACTR